MTDADKIWNRAVQGAGGEDGDEALAALLVLHGSVMNGGLVHALEALDEEQLAAAIAGYRFFGFDDAADVIVEARAELADDADPEEVEETKDGEFFDLISDDETVYEAFEKKLADDPTAFAPVG